MPAADMDSPGNTTKLHVDELILDYLLWHCIDTLLKERKLRHEGHMGKREWTEASKSADIGMRLVNSFTQTFHHLHPNAILPDSIALRLRLCRFTTLLLRRLDPTSATLAVTSTSRTRAQKWLARRHIPNVLTDPDGAAQADHPNADFSGATPFPEAHLRLNMQEMHRQMGLSSIPPPYRSFWGDVPLKDVLKEFMVLTTWTSANHAEVSGLWMQAAAHFMLQALLEDYRCRGARGLDALNECFSWGLTPDGRYEGGEGAEDFEEVIINEMFAGDGGKVNLEFEAVKNEMLADILPPPGTRLEPHLTTLAQENPWSKFEERMVMGYLTAVISAQPLPVLVQLESGKLAGFEDGDVAELLAAVC